MAPEKIGTSPTILARRRPSPRIGRRAGRFLRRSVPPELLRTARGRVANLSLFILVVSALALPIALPTVIERVWRDSLHVTPFHFLLLMVVSSAVMFTLTRFRQVSNQRLLDLALAYEVVLAFGTAVFRHAMPWPETVIRDWSEVAVWIILFSVVIPNAGWKTFTAALVAGLMDPLGLLIGVSAGVPLPSAGTLFSLFGPTFFAVILSVFLSRFIFQMGRDIEEAREMGSYRLVERLGRGGMGEVWRAEHGMLARPAAVKLIPPEVLAGEDARNARIRFEREAKATAMLESEHTIRLYDYGVTEDGTFYYAMEYLDGLDLEELVAQYGPLRPERAVYLLLQVCDSLEEAHRSGVIHRDIKPANIYVCRRGLSYDVAKVLDFGLAKRTLGEQLQETKLTVEGSITGTPAFIAPEVVLGEGKVDGRADIYALGCVAFWMLTGRLVFDEEKPMKVLLAHVHQEPPRLAAATELAIAPELEAIIEDCLAKDPGGRPQCARELAERLASVAFERPWTPQRAEHWWHTYQPELRFRARTGEESTGPVLAEQR